MTEFVVSRLDDAIGVITSLRAEHENWSLWWRGQDVYDWKLSPGVFRDLTPGFEHNFNLRFRTKARARHANCPPNDAYVDWLLLAQHYGLPTRLLDWSESISVGLYFAVQDDTYLDEDGALYCLFPSLLNKNEVGSDSLLMPEDSEISPIARDAFHFERKKSEKILAFLPDQFDIRHIVQDTMMTIHGRPGPMDKQEQGEPCVVKIRVRREGKKDLRELLKFFGASQANLFPDLVNLATDIKRMTFRAPEARKT